MWSRRRTALVVFLYFNVLALLMFGYKYLDFVSRNNPVRPIVPLLEEFTGAYAALVLLPVIVWAMRRFPFRKDALLRTIALHWGIATLYSFAHTSLMAISRSLIFPALGLGAYDYGRMPVRYFMEYCDQLIVYAVIFSLVTLFDNYRAAHAKEVAAAHLESKLTQAKLQNLRLKLQPHFIFNALNTISSVMYEDVRTADEMISRLSDFLRLTLQASEAQEVRLEDELRILDLYLNVMRARFEDRLSVSIDVEQGAEAALVPQLILQPIVENSIRHGIDPATANIRVAVTAQRENGSLRLQVRDHGRGIHDDRNTILSKGIGLSNTAERLEHLYGAQQSLNLENAAEGGLLVTVSMPFHTA